MLSLKPQNLESSMYQNKKTLERIIDERNIDVDYRHNLIEINGEQRKATFENLETGETKH